MLEEMMSREWLNGEGLGPRARPLAKKRRDFIYGLYR